VGSQIAMTTGDGTVRRMLAWSTHGRGCLSDDPCRRATARAPAAALSAWG